MVIMFHITKLVINSEHSKMDAEDLKMKLEMGECLLVAQEGKGKLDVWMFPPDVTFGIQAKIIQSWFHQTRESCFSWSVRL